MEANEQIEVFKEFIDSHYKIQLYDMVQSGKKSLVIDFTDLLSFNPELADILLENSEDVVRAAELSLEQFDLPETVKDIRIRFKNLPLSQKLKISNIRSEHLDKFIFVEGIVRQASDVRPQITNAKFECAGCGNTISILQIDTKFKEPTRCTCGWRGKFRLLKKDLIDVQHLKIEEAPESLEGGEQPKRLSIFLKEDLVEPRMEKRTTPGSRINIYGVVKEVPIQLKTGAQSVRYDLILEANNIESVQEDFSEITLKKEDEEQIRALGADPRIFDKLTKAIAPSIYGHEKIKEALVLQLMGGVRKQKPDGIVTRGDIHILCVGDPGCIAGESQIALLNKGMHKIKELGQYHLQPIREAVTKIRKNGNDKSYDFTSIFQKYLQQPTLKLTTETGKEVICTFNQPFLTKIGWKRADELPINEKIRVMPKLPNHIKKFTATNFEKIEAKSDPLKNVNLPEYFTSDLASLCGYIIGEGYVAKDFYTIICYVNNEETDLINDLCGLWKKTFNIAPRVYTTNEKPVTKDIYEGNGMFRQIVSTQLMYNIEVNSKQVGVALSVLKNKRVPQQLFQSPNKVIAKFLQWLFEADGCAFGKGRGRTAIQLKSRNQGLLKDVQLLLLYFGIQSRIYADNLCIRRSFDMGLYAKHIGFKSKKKKQKLLELLQEIKNKSDIQKRKAYQRYERVVKIVPYGVIDVYDFEVPLSHTFIANGIVCHNSGKSQMLQFMSKAAPKARFVSGKGASGAGLTAAVVKDEFLKGWSLEAGALVLANKGLCVVDELDKIDKEDTAALHSAMEQQIIPISKANIQATLTAQTTLLAAANPKLGRFDPYTPIAAQIDLPSTLINRFDLIFPVRDIPNLEKDEKIAMHVLESSHKEETYATDINVKMLRNYVSYAKRIKPKMTKGAVEEIKNFYVALRNSGKEESGVKPIPISARQLEGIIRLAEASARVRLDENITKDDAKRAIELLRYCLMQVGFDPETGQIDIDRISTGITASARGKIMAIRDIINLLSSKGMKEIPLEEIYREAASKGIEEEKVDEAVNQLKKSGDVFEPKRGHISKVG